MNFKRYLSVFLAIYFFSLPATPPTSERLQRLDDLQVLANYINQSDPIDDFYIAAPAYTILNHTAVERFLAGIPEPHMPTQKRRRRPQSLLAFIKNEWQALAKKYQREKSMNDEILAHIHAIQKGIGAAFKHDIILALLPEHRQLYTFINNARSRKSPVMIRSIHDTGMDKVAAVFPVDAEHVQLGIAQALSARFDAARIEQHLQHTGKGLAPFPSCTLLLQHFIGTEADATTPLVAGVITAFEPTKMIPHITTISALFGLPSAIKKGHPYDTYHVQDGMIFPLIYAKEMRHSTSAPTPGKHVALNDVHAARASTLQPAEIYALEKLIKRVQEEYVNPVSLWFIKHDHTMYLIDLELHTDITRDPRYLDPRYVRKCDETQKAAIDVITPFFTLVELKAREQVILAPNVPALIELYNAREQQDDVRIGIIRDYTSNWQSDMKLLRRMGLKVIRVADINRVRDWMEKRQWPLVVDPQQKVILHYKRCKYSSALFYSACSGTYLEETPTPLSVLPMFIPPITEEQRNQLKPDEFFGGVSLERLFDLLLQEEPVTAQQALRTILFRLKYAIKRAKIPDCAVHDEREKSSYQTTFIADLKRIYSYVETIGWHVLKELNKWYASEKTANDTAQLHFAINMLKGIVLQTDHEPDNLLYTQSFKHLLATEQECEYKRS
jgi:hypothetical protein